uniref:Uncharacterized protein n=1 Tax=Anguilla anguilla TaxID=7936 RepID=A0A0E9P9T3_ANGAN
MFQRFDDMLWIMSSSLFSPHFLLSIALVQVKHSTTVLFFHTYVFNVLLKIFFKENSKPKCSVLEAYQWFASCSEPSAVMLV